MSSPTLNLQTVELISTLRVAPANGSPSSADYNESQRENLSDLASIAGYLNDIVRVALTSLSPGTLLPAEAPVGIEGRTVVADSSDASSLFFNQSTSEPLTVADVLRQLNGVIVTYGTQLNNMGVSVAQLQSRLSSTNQNDVALALRGFRDTLTQIQLNMTAQQQAIGELQNGQGARKEVRITTDPVTANAGSTGAGSYFTVSVAWPVAFPDNNYAVAVSLEDSSEQIYLVSFVKQASGNGIDVKLGNHDPANPYVVTVHAIGIHD